MATERPPISESEYEALVKELFRNANEELQGFGKKLANYCWNLDNYANPQDWNGRRNELIVFGVPPGIRRDSRAKNYFSIYSVRNHGEDRLHCELILPKTSDRDSQIRRIDLFGQLSESSIGEIEGFFQSSDYENLVNMIVFARDQRLRL